MITARRCCFCTEDNGMHDNVIVTAIVVYAGRAGLAQSDRDIAACDWGYTEAMTILLYYRTHGALKRLNYTFTRIPCMPLYAMS